MKLELSHYSYIKKTWLTSTAARRLWCNCARVSLLLVVWPFLYAFMGDWLYNHHGGSLLNLLLLVSVLAAVATSTAMEYYLFTLDDSSAVAQIFWFIVLLLPPIGPAIYCLAFYSRSKYFKNESTEVSQAVSAQ